MFIVADSGSTKTEWRIVENKNKTQTVHTLGINPYYQSKEEISNIVSVITKITETNKIRNVFFYGAGCTSPEKIKIINDVLYKAFPSAECQSASDMLGACRGIIQTKRGIVGILGTGSNTSLFDGKNIEKNVSPLGFILGDEGSGASMGKKLVADCLKNQFPESLKNLFLEEMNTNPLEIIDNVYRKPFPNRYLAGMSRFLKNHINEPECYNIVHSSFKEFFERNLLQYDEIAELGVSFVGSVAFHYKDILERVASEFGIMVREIVISPAEGLVNYHLKN